MDHTSIADTVSRRHVLQLLAAGGVGVAAAACTNTSGTTGSSAASHSSFDIPASGTTSGAPLPKKTATLRWIDSGDTKADFFRAFFPQYEKKHPNLTVKYQGVSWNLITQEVSLGLHNGTAPDVFELPPSITAAQAISNGWLGAVDDIIPNWPEVKKRYPAGVFANGVTDFNGKTYGMPFSGNGRIGSIFLYNADYAKKAGYDLANTVLTWDELRAFAKKCTKQGNGKYYGIIFGLTQSGGLSNIVDTLGEMAGIHGKPGGIDWRTGKYNFTHPLVEPLVELFLGMKSDGSVFPGSASLDQPGARNRFPQGDAAIIFQGPWNIDPWKKDNPSFNLGLNLPPQRDPKHIWPLTYGPGGSDTWWYSSKTTVGPWIGDIFAYLSTLKGQAQYADYNGAGDPPAMPQAIKGAKLDALNQKALKLGTDYTVIAPQPAVRNPDVAKVYEAQKPAQPDYDQTLDGLFTGQIKTSVATAMKGLQQRYDKSLDDAIKLARSRGAKVSREDWVFADWDPAKPYTKLYTK